MERFEWFAGRGFHDQSLPLDEYGHFSTSHIILIFKAALEHYRKCVKALGEFENQYLRSLLEEVVKKRGHSNHDNQFYMKKS
ncbi:MAG: hypothetical protein QXO32_02990 [Candidatus Bathyarchaeia archaeon]